MTDYDHSRRGIIRGSVAVAMSLGLGLDSSDTGLGSSPS